MNTLLGQILISKGAMGWRFTMDLVLAGVLALASWLLIPTWGDQGLAMGHLLAYGATALALIFPVTWYIKKSGGV